MASVDVRIEGVEKAQASLTAAFVRSQNFLPLFTKAKAEISAMNTANFALVFLELGQMQLFR